MSVRAHRYDRAFPDALEPDRSVWFQGHPSLRRMTRSGVPGPHRAGTTSRLLDRDRGRRSHPRPRDAGTRARRHACRLRPRSCSTAPRVRPAVQICATSTAGQPLISYSRCRTRSPGAGRRASEKSDRARTSAKPERHGRPAGSRAHFPQLLPRTGSSVEHRKPRRHLIEVSGNLATKGPDSLRC